MTDALRMHVRRVGPLCTLGRLAGWTLEAAGCWLLAVGFWLLASGVWLLAVGFWLLAVGGWLLAVGGWRLAVGGGIETSSGFAASTKTLSACSSVTAWNAFLSVESGLTTPF
ncbi:hypothetical protein VC273_05915 [Xanthomonas nasturtii]|uniref:hypothetical protein n=1 Tax=Xanthomonas TaxID=338 RepID=UPI002B225D49|nr:hypothetical protein [Xanthomonas nasturtii]MEA9555474.1 hypothetical protein [Xanthomonas nasturtii]